MSIEITIIVTIISASIALAGLIITVQNGLRRELQKQRKEMQEQGISLGKEIKEQRKEMQEQGISLGKEIKEQRKEMQEQGARLGKEIKEQRKEMQEQGIRLEKKMQEQGKGIEGLKIEVAALKATVDTYFRVRVDPPLQSAVAETPEDYDAD